MSGSSVSSASASTTSVETPEGQPPQAAKRSKIYYGWYIVAITFAGTFFSSGINDTVFSVMLKPISEDLGWSRTQISVPISLSIWIGAMLAPLVGRIMDRKGPRWLTTGGAMIVGTTYLILSTIGQFWQFFLFYPIGRSASNSSMLGSMPATAVSQWFVRKRGRALGIQAMAIGFGGATLSLVAQYIINNWGWRTVFVVFGICMWLVVLPAILFLRRRPEDIGLLPDGDTDESADAAASASHRGHGHSHHGRVVRTSGDFTVRDALRTKSLWMLVTVSAISSTGTGAIHLHLAPYLTDSGISTSTTAIIVSISALVGGFGSLFWGLLGERVSAHRGIMLIYATTAAAVIILASFTSVIAAFAFAFMFGFASRGGGVILSIATADYYGRSNLGTIQGIVVPMQTAGLGIGQIVAPLIRDQTGSYQLAFYILAALYLIAAAIGLRIRPPKAQPAVAAEAGT